MKPYLGHVLWNVSRKQKGIISCCYYSIVHSIQEDAMQIKDRVSVYKSQAKTLASYFLIIQQSGQSKKRSHRHKHMEQHICTKSKSLGFFCVLFLFQVKFVFCSVDFWVIFDICISIHCASGVHTRYILLRLLCEWVCSRYGHTMDNNTIQLVRAKNETMKALKGLAMSSLHAIYTHTHTTQLFVRKKSAITTRNKTYNEHIELNRRRTVVATIHCWASLFAFSPRKFLLLAHKSKMVRMKWSFFFVFA